MTQYVPMVDDLGRPAKLPLAAALGVATLESGGYLAQRHPLLHVREEQTSGTAGGTFTSGAWRTRTLNTVVINEITGASLAANQITLPAGTYRVRARANAVLVGNHTAKLRNITAGSDTVIGSNAYADNVNSGASDSFVIGQFTIAADTVFELQHRGATTVVTYGFGGAASFSVVEVYGEVWIEKVA